MDFRERAGLNRHIAVMRSSTIVLALREDALPAEWLKDVYPRPLSVLGCGKVFL